MAETIEFQDIYDFLDNLESEQLELTDERDALLGKLDIAIEGLEEIYNTHEHIPNKYAQGAAKIAAKTLGRLK
jgi:hypothetical protein